ncbi:MAG: T9SS type A sorting domain-containing protein [bacterium]|nr:T9SS type A sorting domain-containing protein [bacterium]
MNYYNTIATALAILFSTFYSSAQTYTTMAAGTWNNTTTVWSTDGGVTPCGCTPGATPGAATIDVAHSLTVAPNLNLTGTTLTLLASGSIAGAFDILANNATMDLFGPASLTNFTQNGTTTTNIHLGGSLLASNQVALNGGTFTVDQATLTTGRVDIAIGATLNLLNGSKWTVTSGNLRNEGTINLDPGSCIETNGNIVNRPTGVINGSGALNSGGNINNQGTIANTISWCANGAGIGMSTPEDCATAVGICGAIVLPIELESFTAEINESGMVELRWITLSERNSSHFVVSKSTDGLNWENTLTIQGAGTTSQTQHYWGQDQTSYEKTYYLLTQYDTDGRKNVFGPVSVENKTKNADWQVFPNPVSSNGVLTLKGLSSGNGMLILSNSQGIQVDALSFNAVNGELEYALSNVQSGIYFMTVAVGYETKTQRVVVAK